MTRVTGLLICGIGIFCLVSCKKEHNDKVQKEITGTWSLQSSYVQHNGSPDSKKFDDNYFVVTFNKDLSCVARVITATDTGTIPFSYRTSGDQLYTDPGIVYGLQLDSSTYSISGGNLSLYRNYRSGSDSSSWYSITLNFSKH